MDLHVFLQIDFPYSTATTANKLTAFFVLCSLKRKPGSLFHCVKKKPCLWEEQQPDSENTAEEMIQTNIPETLSSEKTKQDRINHLEKPGDTSQRVLTKLTWTTSLPSNQSATVSSLSHTEGPQSRMLPPEGGDRETNMQKLAGLEKEAERLRRLLGLEITKTTQGTMTTDDNSTEKPKQGVESTPASSASREVGCQTDVAEVSRVHSKHFRFIMMTVLTYPKGDASK